MELCTQTGELIFSKVYPEIFDKQKSKNVYESFVGKVLPKNKLFVVLGTDGGKLVEYLNSLAEPHHIFIFLETEELVSELNKEFKRTDNFKASFLNYSEFSFSSLLPEYEDYVFRDAITLLKSIQVESDSGIYSGVTRSFKEKLNHFLVNEVANFDFETHFNKQIKNVCDLVHPLSKIAGKLDSTVPGIILGGGPSLDHAIEWLKKNQSKIWIFAASRICRRLIEEGITPDFIGVFDSKSLMFDYSKEMFDFTSSSILVTGEHPYEGIVRQWSGLKTYSRRRFPWAKNSEENFISDGPTVTNALFGIAAYLGVSRLYLAGVDYCFTPNGQCHEASSIENKLNLHDKADTYVFNYSEEKVGTNIQLFQARNLLEKHYQDLTSEFSDFRAFNTSNKAAKVDGIEYYPIEKIKYGTDKNSVVEQFSKDLGESLEQTTEFLKKLQKDISLYKHWFSELISLSEQGEKIVSKIFDNPAKQQNRIDKVLKIKAKIEKSLDVDFQTLVNYGHRYFKDVLKPQASDAQMSSQEIIDSLSSFLVAVRLSADAFRKQLFFLDKEIKLRFEEVKSEPDFEMLAKSWTANKIPGRYLVWGNKLACKGKKFYQAHFPEIVDGLTSQFNLMLNDNTALEKDVGSREMSPDEYMSWLQEIIDSRDAGQLKVAIGSIARFEHDKSYKFVSSFSNGVALEFKENIEDAIVYYQNLDPNHQNLWVQKQLYPLAFKLNKYDLGIKALEYLSLISYKYLPLLADAYHLKQNYENEISALASYLKYEPETNYLVRLLGLLVQQNRVDDANAILQQADGNSLYDQKILENFVNNLNK